jgi:hypothetical protein
MSALLASLALWAVWPAAASAQIIVNLAESGPNVTVTLSGNANTAGLTPGAGQTAGATGMAINPSFQALRFFKDTGSAQEFSGISGPSNFGAGGNTFAFSGTSGDYVGLDAFQRLILPSGYVSGSSLSATGTFLNKSFATLGATPGTYTWTWGGGDLTTGQAFQIVIPAAIPEPGPLALAAVIGVGILSARRFRRKK